MTLLEAIQSRHSVRTYIDKPIDEELVRILQEKVKEVNEKGDDEKLCCMIALGYGNDPGRKHKRKSAKDVSRSVVADDVTPEWFRKGVEAALLAPTAVNQQKFFFTYLGTNENGIGLVKAERRLSLIGYTKMDLGIAKYHFELSAGKENFEYA